MPINLSPQYLEQIPRSQGVDCAHFSRLFVPRSAGPTTIIMLCVLVILYFLPECHGMAQHSPCMTSLDNPSKTDWNSSWDSVRQGTRLHSWWRAWAVLYLNWSAPPASWDLWFYLVLSGGFRGCRLCIRGVAQCDPLSLSFLDRDHTEKASQLPLVDR